MDAWPSAPTLCPCPFAQTEFDLGLWLHRTNSSQPIWWQIEAMVLRGSIQLAMGRGYGVGAVCNARFKKGTGKSVLGGLGRVGGCLYGASQRRLASQLSFNKSGEGKVNTASGIVGVVGVCAAGKWRWHAASGVGCVCRGCSTQMQVPRGGGETELPARRHTGVAKAGYAVTLNSH